MIDFRFHLISIVAVFLALALGMLVGSGFLGDAVINDLKNRVDQVASQNDKLRADIGSLNDSIEDDVAFMEAIEPTLIADALASRRVVLISLSGSDSGSVDEVRSGLEAAGGEAVTALALTEKLGLPGQAEVDQLGLIVGAVSGDAVEVSDQAMSVFGLRAGAAADPSEPGKGAAFGQLLETMSEAGFVDVVSDEDGPLIPPNPLFLVLGGHADEPSFEADRLVLSLVRGLAQRDVPVLVAEPSFSTWGIVEAVRGDGAVRADVATVDQAENIPGRIAIVLGLAFEARRSADEDAGHYGVRSGATSVLPPLDAG